MGTTSCYATHYKPNGKVDVIGEVRSMCTASNENAVWKALKVMAVGSTVYAAVKRTTRDETIVYAEVFKTSCANDHGFNFSYKPMSEDMGPCEVSCPLAILNLLTPTTNESALNWRERCYEYQETKQRNRKTIAELKKLPIGASIEMAKFNGCDRRLIKRIYRGKEIWTDGVYKYAPALIAKHGYKLKEDIAK